MKIITSLEDSGILIKGFSGIVANEAKEQQDGFLVMFLGTLGASFLGILLKVTMKM